MTKNDDFFQSKKPAAVLKHSVLREYLSVFAGMVGSWHRGPIWLVDGYAGPGAYDSTPEDAERVLGSPLVALEVAAGAVTWKSPREVRCVFVESKRALAQKLLLNIEDSHPRIFEDERAFVIHGTISDQLSRVQALVDGAPVLTFLDPFGVESVPMDVVTGVLLARGRAAPSEVLMNLNVEAVSRIGGLLEDRHGEIEPRDGSESTIARVDDFIGGRWWRRDFYDARSGHGSASMAAEQVMGRYRDEICRRTGCSALSVPIRRHPRRPVLFHLTLFLRHDAARLKFADAMARANREWRRAFRAQFLGDTGAGQASLFGTDELRTWSDEDLKQAETTLKAECVTLITANIRRLLRDRPEVVVGRDLAAVLGNTLSLAGESEIKRAWDALADDGATTPREKKDRSIYKATIRRPTQ